MGLPEVTGFHDPRTGSTAAVGAIWSDLYGWPEGRFCLSAWDGIFSDADRFRIGDLEAEVIHSPGHTAASVTFVVGDAAFTHDTLFMPDAGTARCDFPGASAAALWRSIERILALPDATRLFTEHDYRPGGRAARWESTFGVQRASNAHLLRCPDEASFVAMREARDRTLPLPEFMLVALGVNLRAGRLPEPNAAGVRCLEIPPARMDGAAWR